MTVARRQVLTLGGAGALSLVGAGAVLLPGEQVSAKSISTLPKSLLPGRFRTALPRVPVLQPTESFVDGDGRPVRRYTVRARAGTAAMLPTLPTPVLGYEGVFPGPMIEVDRGTRVELTVRNRLPPTHPTFGHPMKTVTHLHGHPSRPQYDGYAGDVILPGQAKTYVYENYCDARTIWYHDHAAHVTSLNAYSGLLAPYVIHDEAERALLPQGEFDVPLVVSDAIFAADGTLAYNDQRLSGLWGDVILVNGKPWPVMKVQRRVYRFRLLNAALSRSFRFELSTLDPVTMVATDGGLMPVAQQVGQWRHAPAERYEFLVDFRRYAPGQRVVLTNRSNNNNIDYDWTHQVMAFDVTDAPVDTSDPTWNTLPTTLVPSAVMDLTESMAVKRRTFRLRRDDVTNRWSIDGETWDRVEQSGYSRALASPRLGDVELWEFDNRSGGWFHPVHIHLVDFKVVSRNGRAPFAWELGPKDVVYSAESTTTRLLMRFGPHQGRYMLHCHNLPHEDHDMMAQFNVGPVPVESDPEDPIYAAPPVFDADPD